MCRPVDPRHVSGDLPWLWPSIMTIAEPPPVTDTVRSPVTLIGAGSSLSRWRSDDVTFLGATAPGRLGDDEPSPEPDRSRSGCRVGGGAVFGKMSNVRPPSFEALLEPDADPCGVA